MKSASDDDKTASRSPLPSSGAAGAGMISRVVLGGFWGLGAQGASLFTSLLVTPFIIRLLGTEDYGLLTLISLLIGYLGFADLGMGVASTKFGAEAVAGGDQKEESAVVWTSMLVTALPALAFAGVLAFLGRPILEGIFAVSTRDRIEAIPALRIAAVALVASAATGVFNTSQLVRMRVGLNSGINVTCRTVHAILTLAVLFMGGGLVAVTGVMAATALLTACLNFLFSARLSPGILQPRVDRRLVAPLLRFGSAIIVSALIGTVVAHGEKLLLVRFASVATLAYYNVAVTLAGLLGMIPAAISVPLMPSFVHLRVTNDQEGSRRLYNSMLRLLIFAGIPAALVICVVAREFFTVWAGPDFGKESTQPLYILAFGWLFHSASHVPRNVLPAWNLVGLLPRYQAIELIPYFVASVFLISRFGISGAAAAWSLRVMVEAFLLFRATSRRCGLSASPLGRDRAVYASAVTGLLAPVALAAFISASQVLILAVTAASVACYGFVVNSLVLTEDEKAWMKTLVSRLLRR